MTKQHKKKLSEAKLKYYASLKAKEIRRPYSISQNYNGRKILFPNVVELIEKFNDILRVEGNLNNQVIIKYRSKII